MEYKVALCAHPLPTLPRPLFVLNLMHAPSRVNGANRDDIVGVRVKIIYQKETAAPKLTGFQQCHLADRPEAYE